MKKTILIDSSVTNEGGKITLHSHDENYVIRIDGRDLMSTRQNYSEKELAEKICKRYSGKNIDVLVGGLGFGGTTKAVLENVSKNSTVITAELMPCVIKWVQDPQLKIDNSFLDDSRSEIKEGDVTKIIRRSTKKFDAIILDVDNGPEALTVKSNSALYGRTGLEAAKRALKPGGTLGIWSATASDQFKKFFGKCGFEVEVVKTKSRPNDKGSVHYLYLGRIR